MSVLERYSIEKAYSNIENDNESVNEGFTDFVKRMFRSRSQDTRIGRTVNRGRAVETQHPSSHAVKSPSSEEEKNADVKPNTETSNLLKIEQQPQKATASPKKHGSETKLRQSSMGEMLNFIKKNGISIPSNGIDRIASTYGQNCYVFRLGGEDIGTTSAFCVLRKDTLFNGDVGVYGIYQLGRNYDKPIAEQILAHFSSAKLLWIRQTPNMSDTTSYYLSKKMHTIRNKHGACVFYKLYASNNGLDGKSEKALSDITS